MEEGGTERVECGWDCRREMEEQWGAVVRYGRGSGTYGAFTEY